VRDAAPGRKDTRGVQIEHGFAERSTFVVTPDGRVAAAFDGLSPVDNVEHALAAQACTRLNVGAGRVSDAAPALPGRRGRRLRFDGRRHGVAVDAGGRMRLPGPHQQEHARRRGERDRHQQAEAAHRRALRQRRAGSTSCSP
jgi:hypothetical protein